MLPRNRIYRSSIKKQSKAPPPWQATVLLVKVHNHREHRFLKGLYHIKVWYKRVGI